jgi:pimeloyl-ACP methyl ester carboxylesterase
VTDVESCWVDLDGPVHYVDYGGPADGPLMVCVHGLGGSLVNWAALAPLLTDTCRVLALDLAGFGHTRSGGRSTSVHANRELLHRFIRDVAGPPVVLLGNSMGGLITILQASAEPETVAGAVLIDPALPVGTSARPDPRVAASFAVMSVPALGRRLLARRRATTTAEQSARATLELCVVDMDHLPPHVLDAHVEIAEQRRSYDNADAELMSAAQSLVWVLMNRRSYQAKMRAIRAPVLLLQGAKDRLVPVGAARAAAAANPGWTYAEAPDLGHVPQLEDAAWTARQIKQWLADNPALAG